MEARSRSSRFGFPGYHGSLPRAVRSSRGRGDSQRKSSDAPSDMGFFELLATVAGQLLQDGDIDEPDKGPGTAQKSITGTAGNTEEEWGHDGAPLNRQRCFLDGHAGRNGVYCKSKEGGGPDSRVLEQTAEDACSVKIDRDQSTAKCTMIEGLDTCDEIVLPKANPVSPVVQAVATSGKIEHGFFDMAGCIEGKKGCNTNCSHFGDWIKTEEASCTSRQEPPILDEENPPLVSSGSSEEALTHVKNKSRHTFFEDALKRQSQSRQEVARLKAKDDDENSSESFVPKTTLKRRSRPSFMKAFKARRLPNGNIRSKTSVVGSKRKYSELTDKCSERSGSSYGNVTGCTRLRTPRWSQSRKKGLQESCASPTVQMNVDNLNSLGFSRVDSEPPASATKLRSVKVSITSFTVPELSVDLPETATVANLKSAVMEAAMNLLGGGLHVRVLLQGEKVPDESATLVQVGISHKERLESLGFMLEPNRIPNAAGSVDDPLLVLSCTASQPAIWYPVFSMGGDVNGSATKSLNGKSTGLLETNAGDRIGLYFSYSQDFMFQKAILNSAEVLHSHNVVKLGMVAAMQGQVDMVDQLNRGFEVGPPFPHASLMLTSGTLLQHSGLEDKEGMALVQMQQNSQGREVSKRRMRRPFTVTEVEALVQAVEMLGTGRWRDVKLRAFEQAKHRTYVDLKDKWKTLVHTAHITPHQRRGEPLPQELLDRVVQANTYWATQQANQHTNLGV